MAVDFRPCRAQWWYVEGGNWVRTSQDEGIRGALHLGPIATRFRVRRPTGCACAPRGRVHRQLMRWWVAVRGIRERRPTSVRRMNGPSPGTFNRSPRNHSAANRITARISYDEPSSQLIRLCELSRIASRAGAIRRISRCR